MSAKSFFFTLFILFDIILLDFKKGVRFLQFKRQIKKFVSLFLCLVLFCAFSSCRSKSNNINWLLDSSPRNIDPQTATLDSELLIIKNCLVGLFEKNADGELFSSFVESYDVS